MSNENVQKALKSKIGSIFNYERKEKNILKKWVEDIAGDDEEFEPIIQSLTKHANILAFDKFKRMINDGSERGKFLKKCAKASGNVPALDEDQLDQLENLLEAMGDNVVAWESDFFEE